MFKIRLIKYILAQNYQSYRVSDYEPGQPVLHAEVQHGQKNQEKIKKVDLMKKDESLMKEKILESDLKAPSKKVGNPRRASFCARMKGMKKKLT